MRLRIKLLLLLLLLLLYDYMSGFLDSVIFKPDSARFGSRAYCNDRHI